MALSADERRRCYLYLGHHQVNRTGVFVGGQPHTTEAVHILETSLDHVTASGETTVRALLTSMDTLYAELFGVRSRFQAAKVEDVTLNPKEWEARLTQWHWFRRQLAVTLDVQLDPPTAADAPGGGAAGPWREP